MAGAAAATLMGSFLRGDRTAVPGLRAHLTRPPLPS